MTPQKPVENATWYAGTTAADRARELAHRCAKPRVQGEGWLACCPAHDDQHPSLSIDPEGARVLVICHAGCATEDVMEALGESMTYLFTEPKPSPNGHKRIRHVYDYYDAQGTLRHQTVRYDTEIKDERFRQRRPDPVHPGEYIHKEVYKDLEPVLYNLPAVMQAIASGEPIHFTEGEHDADTLITAGFVATTNPLGAKSWRDSFTATLTGANVILWGDNDEAGVKAVAKVQHHLKGKTTSLRTVKVPMPHKDVSDWVRAGATKADLEALLQAPAAPAPQPPRFEGHTAKALQGKHFAPLNWVIPGILPPGATLFTGRSKDGKSLLAWNLCMAVATGGKALGTYPVPQGDVLYLCLEDGERRAQTRLVEQMAYMDMADAPDNLLIVTRDSSTIGDGFETKIVGWLDEHPAAKLIVIDILEKVRPKRQRNGSVYADDYAALSPIQQIAQDRNVAILVIHHSNKTKPDDFRDTASGSTGLLAACDTFWSLARLAGAADAVLNIIGRDVDSPALALQFQDGFWTVTGTAEEAQQSRATRDVLDALTTAHKPLTPSQIASTLAMPVGTIRVRLKRMLDRGEVHTSGDGRYIPRTSPLSSPERERHGGEQEGVTPVTDVTPVTPVTPVTLVQSELALQGGVTPTPSLTPWNNGTCDGGPLGSTGITGVTGVTGVTGGEVVSTPVSFPEAPQTRAPRYCVHTFERGAQGVRCVTCGVVFPEKSHPEQGA